MDSLITTFHIDWKIIIAQAINFLIVFLVLYFFAIKPLKKLMAERVDKISKGLTDATSNALVLENTKKEYDDMIVKAKMEADVIWKQGKMETEVKKTAMIAKAKGEVDVLIEAGKKTLEAEKIKMIGDAKKELVSLVVKATEKLLESKGASYDEEAVKAINSIDKNRA